MEQLESKVSWGPFKGYLRSSVGNFGYALGVAKCNRKSIPEQEFSEKVFLLAEIEAN